MWCLSVSPLCICALSCSVSHLLCRLFFIWYIWIWAGIYCWQCWCSTAVAPPHKSRQKSLPPPKKTHTPLFHSLFYCYLFSLLCFFMSGGRCHNISEQRGRSPRQKSDGQWWWQPPEISTYQHHGAVLGKTCRGLSRSGLHACVGEFLLADYPYHFHILIIAWGVYTGSFRAANHDSYGRLNGVFPNWFLASVTSERFWNSWHFYLEWRSNDCHMETEMQLSTKWKWKFNLWLHCWLVSRVRYSYYSTEYISP